jgi:phage baseplate assembly protein V
MAEGFVENAARENGNEDRRFSGVTIARVVANCDQSNLGRVQVHLPWLPNYEPVARLATMDQGTYFVPKVGDEVLVAFNHGDVRDAYVVGCLWNAKDPPPSEAANDPVNMRVIHTPKNHKIEFDDASGVITITSAGKQKVTLDANQIKIATAQDQAVMTLTKTGEITIKSQSKITLDAPTVEIKGATLKVTNTASTEINGGGSCSINAGLITLG